ncbi:unnamed protein product [Paramecium primaurelia]|uniref:Uncharacterized protein n=1 Tax=Paramecium primaurelia TaxID=5886 RepID=A0A8S1K0W0_PARPR|nr:unnamed protein product [Paramecium primaurelia]
MNNIFITQVKTSAGDNAIINSTERNEKHRQAYTKVLQLKSFNLIQSETRVDTPAKDIDEAELPLREHFYRDSLRRSATFLKVASEEMGRYQTEWHWKFFFEFLFYHIMFYNLFGPFMVIFFWKWPGMPLMINMRFLKHHAQFYFQLLLWLGSLAGGYWYLFDDKNIITLTEVVFTQFALLIRAVVIAAKYATLSEERIKLYKQEVLSEEIFTFDLMMWDWRLQTPKVLFLEQLRFLKRRELDPDFYKIDFLCQPHNKTVKQLLQVDVGFYREWLEQQDESQIAPIIDNTFNCFFIFGYLVNSFQKTHSPNGFSKYVVVQSLILSLTPCLLRVQYFYEIDVGAIDILRIIINVLTTFQAFFGSFVFLQIGLYDLQRKFYILDQCCYMLSIKEQNYSSGKKLLPSINFNNPITLQAWSMLRGMAFDYGRTYDFRIQGFYSLIFIGWIFLFLFGIGVLLDFIHIDFFQTTLLSEMLVILTGFIGYYLWHGAQLNEYYETFDILLEDVRNMYVDILRKKEQYFILNLDITNAIHKKFVFLLKSQTKSLETITQYINLIIEEIDDAIRQLNYDEKHNPFKIYGIRITLNFLQSVVVAVFTVVGFAVQQRMQNVDVACLSK